MIRRPTIAEVQSAVAREFAVPVRIMSSEARDRASAHPRQAAMALALKLTGRGSTVVGRHFGRRDHTTVLYAREQVTARRLTDCELDFRLRVVEARLTNGPPPAIGEPVQLAFLDGPLFDRAEAGACC